MFIASNVRSSPPIGRAMVTPPSYEFVGPREGRMTNSPPLNPWNPYLRNYSYIMNNARNDYWNMYPQSLQNNPAHADLVPSYPGAYDTAARPGPNTSQLDHGSQVSYLPIELFGAANSDFQWCP